MKLGQFLTILGLFAMTSACGGGGSGSGSGSATASTPVTGTTGTGSTSTAGTTCSLRDRQDWAFAQMKEWYLFPETLPTSLDPTPYASVSDYVDALTATARAQRRDRYFTYLTSIAAENAFFSAGSSAGIGIRLSIDTTARRVFVTEAFEGAPALAAGIDRGTEILAIGTSTADLRTVSDIIAASGSTGVTDALGPSTAGVTRLLRVADSSGTHDITVSKVDYALTPVSSRYGAKIITDAGRQIGYVNLRTFIDTADPALRNAFAQFRAAGITDVIVDLRYNGGGLVSIAELLGNLLGRDRASTEVFDFTTFRSEKSSSNSTAFFAQQPQSVAPTHIAFIGTGGTASASELVINAFIPYLHNRNALIGTNTYGKPVGQIALDRSQCDDRLRVIAFATQNSARQGGYFDGLAGTVEASCQAPDDLARGMGDPQEGSTRQALNFIAGQSCTAISPAPITTQSLRAPGERRDLLMPLRPTAAQQQVPGLF
ncbi:Peptidase family S41 [Sphingomonas sp. YR710]|uniref:S41 family peptidase n=1 Tax=Sphingomonas sp. YR710 TaxID=1882773 RepID=UPI00087EBE28|nr:S41 family peptidase [Sphingomonas sp. YR710]SDD38518.1 Peptidase family S41 [Sphingomonas sp. YR710]